MVEFANVSVGQIGQIWVIPLLHMAHGVHMDHKPLELPGLGSDGKPHLRPEKEIKISHK